jgi:hypothetical protein
MSELINKKYVCQLEVISPLHIGAGQEKNWTKGIDFIHDGKRILVLDLKKLNKLLGADMLSSLFINRNEKGLFIKIKEAGGFNGGAITKNFDFAFEPSDEVKVQIKNGLDNKPIVPGSSIKGAIRSILFNYLKQPGKDQEKDVFGTANAGDEFMRFIKVSDVQFEKTELMQTKIYNLSGTGNEWDGSWKHEPRGGNSLDFNSKGFHTTYEVIPPLEVADFSIMLSEQSFNNLVKHQEAMPALAYNQVKKKELLHQPIEFLFKLINKHTLSYIEKELAFFLRYNEGENSDYIIGYYNYLKELCEATDKSCLLRMSSGSGFHSITGDWKFEDHLITLTHPEKNFKTGKLSFYKSRRIAFNIYDDDWDFMPMGFVQISLKDS